MSKTIYLCGRGKCCPEVVVSDVGIAISEFGETVFLSKKEIKELYSKIKEKYHLEE